MSLFILNQQKTKTKKLESCIEIKHNIDFNPNNFKAIEQPKYVNSSILIDGEIFGTYSTKEKANEVYVKINQEFKNSNKLIVSQQSPAVKQKDVESIKKAIKNEDTIVASAGNKVEYLNIDLLFEMPKDIE